MSDGIRDGFSVGGKSLGDLSESPPTVRCPITTLECTQGCTHECVSGNLRTPSPKPPTLRVYDLDYEAVGFVRDMLRLAANDLAVWTPERGYNDGICAGKLESAATAISDALGCLHAYLGDEGAAGLLAPRKETT